MKLVLCHNYSMQFNDFFSDIQKEKKEFEYSSYSDLLFIIDRKAKHKISFYNLDTGRHSYQYDGAYITGYQGDFSSADLALASALIFKYERKSFADKEVGDSVSFSKISEAIKLLAANIMVPKTYGGTKVAIVRALATDKISLNYPIVMKRANGERGQDNVTIYNKNEIYDFLQAQSDASIWIMQQMIPSNGFWRLNCYNEKIAYGVFRSLNGMPENREKHKMHMYKPASGENASLVEPKDIPQNIKKIAKRAANAVKRDFAGIDIIVNKNSGKPYVLEVNYYPQIVTVNTFRERRTKEFLKAIRDLI